MNFLTIGLMKPSPLESANIPSAPLQLPFGYRLPVSSAQRNLTRPDFLIVLFARNKCEKQVLDVDSCQYLPFCLSHLYILRIFQKDCFYYIIRSGASWETIIVSSIIKRWLLSKWFWIEMVSKLIIWKVKRSKELFKAVRIFSAFPLVFQERTHLCFQGYAVERVVRWSE